MIQRSIFSLVSVCSVSLLAFAVGCAAPTAGDEEGTTAQDLGSSAGGSPSTGTNPSSSTGNPTSSTGGGGVIDPICIEHHLHNNICIFDWELRAEAETICGKDRLTEFKVDVACPEPDGDPSAAIPRPTPAAASDPIRDPQPSATKVTFVCCNGFVSPPVKTTAAAR